MAALPEIDLASPLQFVINAAAGSSDAQAKREVVEAALRAGGRRGDLLFCSPAELAGVAHQAAAKAIATRTAVVAVGGDGTLNTVAQAAHAAGCAMGVVPQGTFNYFARTHGIPADPTEAVRLLLRAAPAPVQVAGINDRVFLVNASLGLYPDLLEDREAYKARFGRSRWVAFVAACATLLRAQRRLRLHIETGGTVRDVQTLTLFVGNNRLQLQQFGAEPDDTLAGTPRRRQHGRAGAAAHRNAVDDRPDAAWRHGQAGRGRGRGALRVRAPGGAAHAAAGPQRGEGGLRRRGDDDARAARLPRARQAAVPADATARRCRHRRPVQRRRGSALSVLLQISDTHFGTEQGAVVEALGALAHQQRPDVVVLSGDITQRARPAQFRAARAFVDRLGAPVLAVPGNHDIPLFDLWARLRSPYGRYSAAFGTDLEPVHRSAELLVVCVNTTRPWRHKDGEVSALQIDRVARLVEHADPAQLRVVVVHQPIAVTRAEDEPNRLRGHAAALQRWAEAGADLVMGGHIHLPYVMPLQGLARPLWVVQAGTAVSSRVRDGVPNSVNLLRWGADAAPGCCRIEQWDYKADDRAFRLAKVSEVRPDRT